MQVLSKLFFAVMAVSAASAASPLDGSRQCLLVVTANWDAHSGVMVGFERENATGPWRQRPGKIPVVVGQAGLAWGRGLAPTSAQPGPIKREGDRKAPAGVFALGSAFGAAPNHQAGTVKLPYRTMNADSVGVDDPKSRYYNQIVDRSKVPDVDWKTSERMLRKDTLYRWGILVRHNSDPVVPGAGSCIFLHVWRNAASGTFGCTAMEERQLVELLAWLDPSANPLLVQLPQAVFTTVKSDWHLPVAEP
jgi:L,D-peptidoglycan transpeptidase YkuD (ErfK/YbiS/YcfS/YnhG family)